MGPLENITGMFPETFVVKIVPKGNPCQKHQLSYNYEHCSLKLLELPVYSSDLINQTKSLLGHYEMFPKMTKEEPKHNFKEEFLCFLYSGHHPCS